LNLNTNTGTTNGEIKVYDRIKLALIEFGLMFGSTKAEYYDWYAALNAVTDEDRLTYVQLSTFISSVTAGSLFFDYTPQPIQPSTENQVLTNNYNKKYFCVDLSLSAGSYPCNFEIGALSVGLTNIYGHTRFITSALTKPILTIEVPNAPFNFIPNKLMVDGGGTDATNYLGRKALVDGSTYRIIFTINDESPSIFASTQVEKIRFAISLKSTTGGVLIKNIRIKDVAIIGEYAVETIAGDIFTRVQGETLHDNGLNQTNNVYMAFRRILEDYAGIPYKLIDYGDLATNRSSWHVGRTITEQKNSVDYLNELCSHSFVGMFAGRTGKRMLRTFQNFGVTLSPTITHDASVIVRNSITQYEKTDTAQLYNSFYVQYNYDQGSQKFTRAFFLAYIGEDTSGIPYIFPAVDETTVVNGKTIPKWWTFLGGLSGDINNPSKNYADSKVIWELCQAAFLKNGINNKAQADISQLTFFVDSALYNPAATIGTGTASSAFYFLQLLAQWATLQKDKVTYSIPINATNVVLDLLDTANFKDAVYTNDSLKPGWCTSIEVDALNNQMKVQVTLQPPEIQANNLIVERGTILNTDTITEHGNDVNTITEPGV
jgi:hypothetical protein